MPLSERMAFADRAIVPPRADWRAAVATEPAAQLRDAVLALQVQLLLPQASLLPMSADRNATGSPIPRG